jgi:hypothetical protein
MGHCSSHNIAAGLVTSDGSCAGFMFEKMRGIDKYDHWMLPDTAFENDQPWLYGVTAHKSYFWFGDQCIALGCGITNNKPEYDGEIITTIDQTLLEGDVTIGSTLFTLSDTATHILVKPAGRVNASETVSHNQFVFRILEDQTPGSVHAVIERRATRWDELNLENREILNKTTSADMFQLWIGHGKTPLNDTYGYSVFCGNGEVPPVPVVLSNTTHVQAMATQDCHHLQAIFYTADSIRCGDISFHVPVACAFSASISSHQVAISVSDATMNPLLDTIAIKINMALQGAQKTGEKQYVVHIPLPGGKYRGKQSDVIYDRMERAEQ